MDQSHSNPAARPPRVCHSVTRRRHAALSFLLVLLAATTFNATSPSVVAGDRRTQQSIDAENAYILATPSGVVRHVSPSGGDCSGCGTPSLPYKTLAYAAGQLRPGDTLYVHAGTYAGTSFSLSSRGAVNGTAAAPITVKGAPGEARPVLRGAASTSTIVTVDRSYWIFEGLEFDGGFYFRTLLNLKSHHIALKNNLLRDSGKDAVVIHEAAHILLQANEIRNTIEVGESNGSSCSSHSDCAAGYACSGLSGVCQVRDDGHAVSIVSNSHSITLRNNAISDNTGDGLQCSGPLQGYVPGNRPYDILLEGNQIFTRASHQSRTENAVDVKDCDRVTLRGENYHGFRSTGIVGGNNSGGSIVVFHFSAAGMLLEDSDIHDACGGVSTGNNPSDPVGDIVIRRNRFRDLKRGVSGCAADGSSGSAIYFQTVNRADVYHNTFSRIDGRVLALGSYPVQDVEFWNNIVSTSHPDAWWVYVNASSATGIESDYNLFWHAGGIDDRFYCSGRKTLSQWRSGCSSAATRDPRSAVAVPQFVNESTGDVSLQASSPAVDTALDNTLATSCGAGPDKGAIERCGTPGQQPGELALVLPLTVAPASPIVNETATASFTVENIGGEPVMVQYFLAGSRSPSGTNVDFPASEAFMLQPGQQYTYRGAQVFATPGTYTAWPSYYDGANWIGLASTRTTFEVTTASPGRLTLVTALSLTPPSPVVNQTTVAEYVVENTGGQLVTVQYFLAGSRNPSGGNVDFPPSPPVTVQAGQRYTYRGSRSFATAGAHTAWPVYFDGSSWIELAPARTGFEVRTASPGKLTLATGLALTPASPQVNQTTTADYLVENTGGQPVTVQYFLAGCRSPSGANVDFPPSPPVTLQPGERYAYRASRAFGAAGTHTAWPAYFDGVNWIELAASRTSFLVGSTSSSAVQYGYVPPAQWVGGGSTTTMVPAGYIHQTAWAETGGSGAADIRGVYAYDYQGWTSMVWRWADTMRQASIQRVTAADGRPAYRMEIRPDDHASPGTAGDHPRAEFFSVDAAEDRRQREPPRDNIFRDGDEDWATFALYLPGDFPDNHRWATLVQRKFQNNMPAGYPGWFTLNVHRTTVDVALPGTLLSAPFVPIASLAELENRWVQFVFHEKVSSGSDGYFEIFMDGVSKARRAGPTIPAGDINFNIHYGYYRANERDDREPTPPGVGVAYYSPLMVFRGAQPGVVPVLR